MSGLEEGGPVSTRNWGLGKERDGERIILICTFSFTLPEVLDVIFQFIQLEQVPHGVAVEESLCGRAPVDI